jgi:hypothetical protein
MLILGLYFLLVYFAVQSSLRKKVVDSAQYNPADEPSLLGAWCRSAAWAAGCIGSCVLLRGWADAHNAFENGSNGGEPLALLLLAVVVAAVLFHMLAYKEFRRAYCVLVASWPPAANDSLALTWLVGLSLLRVGWGAAVLLLGLGALLKNSPPTNWL